MTKKVLSILLFVASFLATYILLCFLLTGAKMAAEATALDYVRAAVTYMAVFKIVVSLVVASLIGSIPQAIEKRKR